MAKGTRTNISVPAELKARMDAAEEPTNWSAVACAAFEQRLAEIITRKGAKDMKDVIARLRASKGKLDTDRFQQGKDDGRRWAENVAEAEELERLEALPAQDWNTYDGNAYSGGEHFVFSIKPETDGDRGDAAAFWERNARGDHAALSSDGVYIRGFKDGALDVWDEVKDQL